MIGPPAKTPLGMDLFYGGDWHPIAPEAWSRDPVEVSAGRTSETKRVRPTLVTATLGNNARQFSPRRPESPLYGLIGRATPLRVYTTLFADAFTRTVGSGWGTNPDSLAGAVGRIDRVWTVAGAVGSGSTSVGAGVGVHTQTTAAGARITVLDPIDVNKWRDCEVRGRFAPQLADVTGGQIEPGNLMLRYVDASNYYVLRVEIATNELIFVSVRRVLAGVETILSSVLQAPVTFTGQTLAAAFLAEGPVLSGKVWDPAVGEPYGWQVTAVDTALPAAGTVGVRTGVAVGNSNVPVTVNYDDLEVRVPEAMVEVDRWPQRQSLGGHDRWVPIRASGITQRLSVSGAGTDDRSALRRAIDFGLATAVYYPLEKADQLGLAMTSTQGPAGAAGAGRFRAQVTTGGVPVLGDQVGLPPAPFYASTTTTILTVHVRQSFQDGPAGADNVNNIMRFVVTPPTGAATDVAELRFTWTGILPTSLLTPVVAARVILVNGTNVVLSTTGAGTDITDGKWHEIQIRITQNGANIDSELWIDGTQRNTSTDNSITMGRIVGAGVWEGVFGNAGGFVSGSSGFDVCHITVHTNPAIGQFYVPMTGHAGEQAHARIARLAGEEGVTLAVVGAASERMGPQLPAPPLESIFEAADTDLGIVVEPRGRPGLVYKTRDSLVNQPAAVTLDFAAGDEAAAPSEGSEDLDFVVNDLTVQRRDGGEVRVVKTVGTLNVNDPTADPQGVGRRRPPPLELSLAADQQLDDQAGWRVHLGTWDETRYPDLSYSPSMLHTASKTAKLNATTSVDIGDRVTLNNPPSGARVEDQQIQGVYRTYESHRWSVEATTSPYGPLLIGQLAPSSFAGRVDSQASTTAETIDIGETAIDVNNSGGSSWSQNTPYLIVIGGEVMDLTSATTPGPTQTLTVTRAVNGVIKAHNTVGVQVRLYRPLRLARGV